MLAAGLLACGVRSRPPGFPGTFTGTTADGRPLTMFVSETNGTLYGTGSVGEEPFVLNGAVRRLAIARLTGSDGKAVSVSLHLDGSDGSLRLEHPGQGDAVMIPRGTGDAPDHGGPFSGRWESHARGVVEVEMALEQRGLLASGWARILGTHAAVAGRIVDRRFIGTATLADESQMPIVAELAPDGRALVVSQGFESRMERR
jgi:hypothetical protein